MRTPAGNTLCRNGRRIFQHAPGRGIERAVPWTKPDDMPYTTTPELRRTSSLGAGSKHPGGFNALFATGRSGSSSCQSAQESPALDHKFGRGGLLPNDF